MGEKREKSNSVGRQISVRDWTTANIVAVDARSKGRKETPD